MLAIDGSTMVLIISILAFLFSLFLYTLGTDIKARHRREKRQTRQERLMHALKKRWHCLDTQKE